MQHIGGFQCFTTVTIIVRTTFAMALPCRISRGASLRSRESHSDDFCQSPSSCHLPSRACSFLPSEGLVARKIGTCSTVPGRRRPNPVCASLGEGDSSPGASQPDGNRESNVDSAAAMASRQQNLSGAASVSYLEDRRLTLLSFYVTRGNSSLMPARVRSSWN